jgi:hypothetical protein
LLISLDPASAHLRDPETWYLGYDGDELLRPAKIRRYWSSLPLTWPP